MAKPITHNYIDCRGRVSDVPKVGSKAMTSNACEHLYRLPIAVAIFAVLCAPAAAAPHNVDELFRLRVVRDVALSPEGTRAALIYRADEKAADMLYVVDTDSLDSPSSTRKISLGAPEHLRAVWVRWVTETRLLLGMLVTQGQVTSARVEAIDADGTHPTVLFSGSKRILKESLDLSQITSLLPNDPTHIIMPAWTDWTYDLFNVDVTTGQARQIAKGRSSTWVGMRKMERRYCATTSMRRAPPYLSTAARGK